MSINPKQTITITLFLIVAVLSLSSLFAQSSETPSTTATDIPLETSLPMTLTAQTTSITSLETALPMTLTALSTSEPQQPVFTPTPNTECPNPIITNANGKMGFDFEIGTECWNASEESLKRVHLEITDLIAHSGSRSLQVITELFGDRSLELAGITDNDQKDIYRHTEITAYLDRAIPEGYAMPGPYDLTGKTLSCFVYLPDQLTLADRPWPYIRLFAKDVGFANLFGEALDIDPNQVNKWIELSLVVDNDGDFDASVVNAIGIRIEVQVGSKLSYIGPIFIDDCTIS